ncbi:MAG: hypothetical protein IT162_16430 [Bryobacterales bacterium]|nr:hypothetical protein [Bryobacterales bacterium]
MVVFVDSAFKHYDEDDFFEVPETDPLKLRSRRGLDGIYELLGKNHRGAHLHIAYRQEAESGRRLSYARDDSSGKGKVSKTMSKTSKAKVPPRVRLPRKSASYQELSNFFDRHDAVTLLNQGVTEVDPDRADLDRMLAEYWKEANSKQLNNRIPVTAKRMIEMLAKRKTIEVSTLVRMWVIECMRREATQP